MGKNKLFAEGLAGAVDTPVADAPRSGRLGMGVLSGRTNRLSELATGSVVTRAHENVDPARCRMWRGHNRDYAALSEERCHDLIESIKSQGRQEVPAIVRRVTGDPDHDFEVVCGARRHWSVSWLRSHNYPETRFLIEIRELTDEEAFRLADLENRAREDISDLERARDYLRALGEHYDGRQASMAERLKVSVSWVSRYLDLARLPQPILAAMADPHQLGIKHVTQIKPLLKPDDKRARVVAEAERIALARKEGKEAPASVADVIRALSRAADAPKKSGTPKKSGKAAATINAVNGKALLRIDRTRRAVLALSLPLRSGASRAELDAAITKVLDEHWS